MSYIIVLLVFPFVGLIVYYLFGQEYRKSKIFNRKNIHNKSVIKRVQEELELDAKKIDKVDKILDEKSKLIPLLYNNERSKLTINNSVEVIKDGDRKFELLFEDIKSAKHHIHLEYFIIKDNKIGMQLIDLLCEKINEGVAVRMVMDDVGSSLKNSTKKRMRQCGIEFYSFMPVLFSSSTGKMNYRDHRKIVVIDGKIGYVGGINISDTYVNAHNDRYWRDTHLRIVGEAVKPLQILFLTTWDFASGKEIRVDKSFFADHNCRENVPLQIAASGPDTDWSNIMEAIFVAITNASGYIYITTPYFIPNDEIVTALQVAARCNVKVKIIVPKSSDSWIAEYATNSYLGRLLEAGVEVYHYTKGFVHAKTMVVDGVFSSIGTANMDYRSFNINFEVNALIYHKETSETLKSFFEEDLKDAEQLELNQWRDRPKRVKLVEAVARLLAPLL